MDLNELQAKKEKKKSEATPVRIDQKLYEKLKTVADEEVISIIKLTEFFLENSVIEYYSAKKHPQKKNKNGFDIEYILDLFFNLLDVHKDIIKSNDRDTDAMLNSVEEIKELLTDKFLNKKGAKTND
jgi:hypothetical protein